MRIVRDAWLTEVLDRPVFSVHDVGRDGTPAVTHAAAAPGAFYFAKVAAGGIAEILTLSSAGFYVVEASVTFGRPVVPVPTPREVPGVAIVPLDAGAHAGGVLGVAERSFRYSRFHVDPRFDVLTGHRVKREWIRSYIEGRRGDQLLVATHEGRPIGWLALLFAERDGTAVGVIDLVAVDPEWQGRGVGPHLVSAALHACRDRVQTLEVGTQAGNVPSVRLYESLGFRLLRSGFVLHFHAAAA